MMRRRVVAAIAIIGATMVSGCDKVVAPLETLPPLEPTSTDMSAGSWRMILLSGPTQFAVAAPAATNSPAYQAELVAIKAAQAALTNEQRAAIAYWSGGGVMRWNQILRGLVARYNLPPAPQNGGYPVPDADNPFGDPAFPFANPVYAARAYSYVSAAQYDALKAAWYWKAQYGRLSPARNDPSIAALAPLSELPSYPSEEGVISAVTVEMLKALFPAALQEITLKAAEQRNVALWSGKATASDIAAGVALGKSVAATFLARASGDGMRNAVGTPAAWQAMADSATARGDIAWSSREVPPRPPMLPLFGKVSAWMMTPDQVAADRPPPPPATGSPQMKAELATVKNTVDHLTRAQYAIALKWNDGAGSYTPPGHWNGVALNYVRDAKMSEVRAARVFALLNVAMHDAGVGCWEAKYHYFNPRPTQLDPTIKTQIGLPNFPSYTSGHSTFSAAAASVLSYLFPNGTTDFETMRDEAGISRLYGGIHFPSDIAEGKAHGIRIAAHTLSFATSDGTQ